MRGRLRRYPQFVTIRYFLGQALRGSSMTMMSPPRPVNVPPTEVASRKPRAENSISASQSLYGPIRVAGKARERPTDTRATDQGAEVIGMLFGELPGIANADEPARRIEPEDVCRKGDRGRDRFEHARRHVDDQPLNFAAANLLQAVGHRLDVPGPLKFLAWTEGYERLVDEGQEIVAQQALEDARVSHSRPHNLIGPRFYV